MTVFKKTISENIQARKFVGGHIPLQTYTYLTLFGLSEGISKSSIINQLLRTWQDDNKTAKPLEALENETALQAVKQYRAAGESKRNLIKFRIALHSELKRKDILPISISNILKIFTDETKDQTE